MARALIDLWEGIGRFWLWGVLAWSDIRQRYRGSVLGPFWLTLSSAIMIGSLGILYARLFKADITSYLPSLALGLLVWSLISTTLTESCSAFFSADHIIRQIKLPLSVYIYRLVARNLIVFAHNIVVSVVVLVWFHVPVGWRDALAVPGLMIIVLTSVPASLVLALLCARFRDMPQIVASLLQVIFFLTPIMWDRSLLGSNGWVVGLNPFAAFIDIVRAPLLGQLPDTASWFIALGVLVLSWLIAVPLFARVRGRVAYWM
jgi:ABC-type polysaccharide/polyol phosphate export permease